MKPPFQLIIKVDADGRPGIKVEPPGTYHVQELQELLRIALQIVGQTQLTFNGEKPDGNDTANKTEA